MRVVTHDALVSRRRRTALLLSMGGVAVLGLGLVANFYGAGDARYVTLSYVALAVGTILSWIGISVSDRWALPPRADIALAEGLEGAGQAYKLYNWLLPAEHVLLAPWGLTVFAVYNCDGPVDIQGKKWRDKRSWWRRLLSFGRRPVKEPSRLLHIETSQLASALVERDESGDLGDIPVEGVAVFTRLVGRLTVRDPSVPALEASGLRDWVRDKARHADESISPGRRRRLERILDAMAEERTGG